MNRFNKTEAAFYLMQTLLSEDFLSFFQTIWHRKRYYFYYNTPHLYLNKYLNYANVVAHASKKFAYTMYFSVYTNTFLFVYWLLDITTVKSPTEELPIPLVLVIMTNVALLYAFLFVTLEVTCEIFAISSGHQSAIVNVKKNPSKWRTTPSLSLVDISNTDAGLRPYNL